jgi:predicted DsbA family dithiol-disulfide isomerase
MFERPILIYSNYCNYSKLFIQHLQQFPELYESFIRLNIDYDLNTKQRPTAFYEIQELLQFKITDVPTIIVQNGEYILSGKEAFTWLEYQLNELNKQLEMQQESNTNQENILEPFNPLEMGSFSDGYAGVDNSLPNSQSFQFLNEPIQNINTPQDSNENFEKQNSQFDGDQEDYSNYMKKRNSVNNNPRYQSSQNRPLSHSSNNYDKSNSKINKKQNEIDKKYEELLAQREMTVSKKKVPKRVNFADGTFQ